MVDFKIIEKSSTYGKFYVNWEDSEMGGDYDQDMWGIIEYSVSGDTITVTTNAVSASTANGQGFGYVISGTPIIRMAHIFTPASIILILLTLLESLVAITAMSEMLRLPLPIP